MNECSKIGKYNKKGKDKSIKYIEAVMKKIKLCSVQSIVHYKA